MDAAAVRALALGLPEAEEYDHGGLPAFRVRGARFATMLDAGSRTVNLMLGEAGIREAAAAWPEHCSESWYAGRLNAARVDFAAIEPALMRELVTDAYRNRAPAALRRLLD
ncbi:MmcQ/YjbR family DNA-binding protein [Leifsonia sp. F6_8S_P_1B]|uniref:MmcQ/YjbR family DNA-binding protein n=1 Tax=Leifsonia williamsii TaxID=3035919 RepID=A0ABT8KAP4_9MICO|nr:MmcQ/YjbR family DNA-binding protein [Leifsonia williamsii]MDN4614514.1 MmcQ/YjbR family DNA-binding protein [Leifsonia williamsii]